jgi:hypothetical protein
MASLHSSLNHGFPGCIGFVEVFGIVSSAIDITSAIDLTVADPSLLLDFSWRVHDDLCGGDHFPTVLESLHSTVDESVSIPSLKIHNPSWEIKSSICLPLSVVVLLPHKGLCPLESPMIMNGVGN